MNLYFDQIPVEAIAAAIPMYSKREFESPTRSTMALLSFMKYEQPKLNSILKEIGMPADCDLHLEYKVKPQKGRGRASQTDLMVKQQGRALAIEAKWTESRSKTVCKWLKEGSNPQNRENVLIGWLSLLQKHAQHSLCLADFPDAVYQMVHRAASACAAGRNPQMAYLVFKSSPPCQKATSIQQIHADLENLWELLDNPSTFPFYLIEVPLSPIDAFKGIEHLKKGQPETAQQVSTSLLGSTPLFDFNIACVTKIGDKP